MGTIFGEICTSGLGDVPGVRVLGTAGGEPSGKSRKWLVHFGQNFRRGGTPTNFGADPRWFGGWSGGFCKRVPIFRGIFPYAVAVDPRLLVR